MSWVTKLLGRDGNTQAGIDAKHAALRVSQRPVHYGAQGIYRFAAETGTIAAALAANSEIFQFRWTSTTHLALLYRCYLSAGANVAATAAALIELRLSVARSWTVAGSGGTRVVTSGNNLKTKQSMGTSLLATNDLGIATTGALTAGTKTFDASDAGIVVTGIGTGAITTSLDLGFFDKENLLSASDAGEAPIVLTANEGVVIRSGSTAFPAGMTWHAGLTFAWAEVLVADWEV